MNQFIQSRLQPYISVYTNIKSDYDGFITLLKDNWNFGFNSSSPDYHTFWGSLDNSIDFRQDKLKEKETNLVNNVVAMDDLIEQRFHDVISMVQQIDSKICIAMDTYSRCIDVIWSYKTGTAYISKKDQEGNFIKKKMNFYTEGLSDKMQEFRNIMNGEMNDVDANDGTALQEKKDKIELILKDMNILLDGIEIFYNEVTDMIDDTKTILEVDFRQAFKVFVVTSITFSLGKKAEQLQSKVVGSSYYEDDISKAVAEKAKYWKHQINPDNSKGNNREYCLDQAFVSAFKVVNTLNKFESFIDKTFDIWFIERTN